MFRLLKNGTVVSSYTQQRNDILIYGAEIVALFDEGSRSSISIPDTSIEVIDLEGKYLLPGLIDTHCHFTGAGGEAGACTRAPEVPASVLAHAGITTAIGLLGADHYSRTIENLIAKTRALNEEGLTAYCLTGSYAVPPTTLTGDIGQDIYFVSEMRGLGEIALSDGRSSEPTKAELRRMVKTALKAAAARGMKGAVVFHIGNEVSGLAPLRDMLEGTHIQSDSIIATHINRNEQLMREVLEMDLGDTWIDLTAIYFESTEDQGTFMHVEDAIRHLISHNPHFINRITVTSDCGTCVKEHQATPPSWLYRAFRATAEIPEVGLHQAVKMFMENPAQAFGLSKKGYLRNGMDADIIVADSNLSICSVFARGHCIVGEGSRRVDFYDSYEV